MNNKSLPLKDLIFSGLIVFILSIIIGNIYNLLWAISYALANILILTTLGWLYDDSWNNKV